MIEGRIIITDDLNTIIKNYLENLRKEDKLNIEIQLVNIDEIIEVIRRLRDVIEIIVTTKKIDRNIIDKIREKKIKIQYRRVNKVYVEDRIYMYHNNNLYRVDIDIIIEEYEPPKTRY